MTKLSIIDYFQNSSLQRNLLFFVVLPMLVLVGLAIRFGLTVTNDIVVNNMRGDLDLIARAIRVPISDALLEGDTESIHSHLESVFEIGRVYGASIYDINGNLVAATGVIEADLSESRVASEVVRTGEQQDGYRSVAGQSLFSQFLPINDRSGRIHGLLQINRRGSDFEQSLHRISTIAWMSWFALATASLLIMWLGHKYVLGRPINDLLLSMRKVATSDKEYRARLSGPIEFQELAKGLNQMLDEIKFAQQQLLAQQIQQNYIEQKLKEKETMAAIGQVVSGVAHELGAPLSVIDGRAQRLLRHIDDEPSHMQLDAIRGQVQRLTNMVKQLQAFAYTPVTKRQFVNLNTVLEQAIISISYELQKNEVLPILVQPCPLIFPLVDKSRFELAIVNVLRNAVQVAKHDVQMSCTIEKLNLLIQIEDDGPGLPNTMSMSDIIRPFVSSKPQGKGTGLGLAIVQQIMHEHDGSVTLDNCSNKGCRATLTIPLLFQDARACLS